MVNPFSHLDDRELMELYKNGEDMAFEVIYLRHKDRVYTYLNKRLVDKDIIEDIFQSIFVKFHKSRHLYNGSHPLLKWLYVICKSELLDSIKKNKASLVELNEGHLSTSTEELTHEHELDLNSINSLSQKEKEALNLRYYFEQEYREISKILNTTESNSRKLVSRGIKKLRTKFLGETK